MSIVHVVSNIFSSIGIFINRPKLRVNIKPLFQFCTFVMFYQLLVSLFSIWKLSFSSLIVLGALGAILLTWLSSNFSKLSIKLSWFHFLLNLAFLFVFTKAFIGLLNYHIMDIVYPTNLLGMVTQITRGRFPASFISFPEFPANYHQGFLIVSGSISYLSKIAPINAIRATFIFYFLCLNILFLFFSQKFAKNAIFGLFPILIATISGFSNTSRYGSKYLSGELSLFEYFSAKTVPESAIIFLLLALYLWKVKNRFTYRSMAVIALYILSCSAINGTIYSFLILTSIATVGLYVYRYFRRTNFKFIDVLSKFLAFFSLLGVIWILPKYFPSVYLQGASYGKVRLLPRYLDPDWKDFLVCYFRLAGPFIYIGIVLSISVLIKAKTVNVRSALSILILGSFVFPILIFVKEIQAWDNAHKTLLLGFFCTLLLMVTQFRHAKGFILISSAICIFLVKPVFIDLYSHRNFSFPRDDQEIFTGIQDISSYLFQQSGDVVLLPFGNPLYMGHPDLRKMEFTRIAAASGQFVLNNYSFVFLIADDVYKEYAKKMYWWKDPKIFNNYVLNFRPNEFIIVYKGDMNDFMGFYEKAINTLPNDQRYQLKIEKTFENYTLLKRG